MGGRTGGRPCWWNRDRAEISRCYFHTAADVMLLPVWCRWRLINIHAHSSSNKASRYTLTVRTTLSCRLVTSYSSLFIGVARPDFARVCVCICVCVGVCLGHLTSPCCWKNTPPPITVLCPAMEAGAGYNLNCIIWQGRGARGASLQRVWNRFPPKCLDFCG